MTIKLKRQQKSFSPLKRKRNLEKKPVVSLFNRKSNSKKQYSIEHKNV